MNLSKSAGKDKKHQKSTEVVKGGQLSNSAAPPHNELTQKIRSKPTTLKYKTAKI